MLFHTYDILSYNLVPYLSTFLFRVIKYQVDIKNLYLLMERNTSYRIELILIKSQKTEIMINIIHKLTVMFGKYGQRIP